jgi:Holliday junction resolvase RusA-like endonuclease
VRDRNWPVVGDHGPGMKDGVEQQPSSSAIAETEQGDRRDPVTVIISGDPVAKARPRMTRRGFVYTPAATRKFEAHSRLAAQMAMDGRPPIEAPVRIELLVELPVPVSWSRRKTADAITGHIRPTSRPDVDNYLKAILDAINTIVAADDAQVVEVCAKKKFSVAPKMIATIFPLDATPSNRRASR